MQGFFFYGDTNVYFDTSNYRLSIVMWSTAHSTARLMACNVERTELKRFYNNSCLFCRLSVHIVEGSLGSLYWTLNKLSVSCTYFPLFWACLSSLLFSLLCEFRHFCSLPHLPST